ncbi:MAG TPA: hypothetical protein PLO89_10805, partial [Spirochaetota bacterium]|nr:hypothetical protein [Spirochaetota bacterium]
MGLLKRAVQYREALILAKPKGLLSRALSFLESKNNDFPKIIVDNEDILPVSVYGADEASDFGESSFSTDVPSENVSNAELSSDFFNEVSMDFNNEVKEEIAEESPLMIDKNEEEKIDIDSDIRKIKENIENENLEINLDLDESISENFDDDKIIEDIFEAGEEFDIEGEMYDEDKNILIDNDFIYDMEDLSDSSIETETDSIVESFEEAETFETDFENELDDLDNLDEDFIEKSFDISAKEFDDEEAEVFADEFENSEKKFIRDEEVCSKESDALESGSSEE